MSQEKILDGSVSAEGIEDTESGVITIYGSVDISGNRTGGKYFTSQRTGLGSYSVSFLDVTFGESPAVVVTACMLGGGAQSSKATPGGITQEGFIVGTGWSNENGNNRVDQSFNFIAMGRGTID